MNDPVITIEHIRQAGFCVRSGRTWCMRGVRAWCVRHGVDTMRLLTKQVTASEIERIGDPFGLKVVAVARKERKD